MTATSEKIKKYFDDLDIGTKECYAVANKAREKGFDPDVQVEIPLARDMAERVEGLVSVAAPQIKGSGLSQRIKDLEKIHGSQNWRIAFLISEEVARQNFCKFKDEKEAMEISLRVGLAYITNGVVSSPLEGFVKLELRDRKDGKGKYFALFFGGPIRSAGTTATCIFAAVCDYVRMKMGYQVYDPDENEINRTFSELEHFHDRITNLQYLPTKKEVDFLTKYLHVQIEGDASEKIEVPNYKDLPRVSTNNLRNGFCLVMAEGLAQKFAKFWGKFSKWYKEIGMDHWIFLEEFVVLQKEIKAHGKSKSKGDGAKISPDYTFIKDLVAGRPVIGHPLASGTFRIRLGRARTCGLSDDAISPTTMVMLDGFIAYGTQLKTERPGKSTVISSCDIIEGPIVKLKNGDVVFVESEEQAKTIHKDVAEVIFLGVILTITKDDPKKRYLELIGLPHQHVAGEYLVIEGKWADAFKVSLGFYNSDLDLDKIKNSFEGATSVLDILNKISDLKIKDKSGLYMGSRMGRPEKAKMRKLTGSPHALFPVGKEGGRLRCFQATL